MIDKITDLSKKRHAGKVLAVYENGDIETYEEFLLIGVRADGHGGEATVSIQSENAAERIITYGEEMMVSIKEKLAKFEEVKENESH
jgi:hypothetical protein